MSLNCTQAWIVSIMTESGSARDNGGINTSRLLIIGLVFLTVFYTTLFLSTSTRNNKSTQRRQDMDMGELSSIPNLTIGPLRVQLPTNLRVTRRPRTEGVTWTSDIYEPGFRYPNAKLCPNYGRHLKVFIFVHTAPAHFSLRNAIRTTWGQYTKQQKNLSMGFLIGRINDQSISDRLAMEQQTHDDLILENNIDAYNNLTLKSLSALEWIETYCNRSPFLLKADDDHFIRIPFLMEFIDKIRAEDEMEPKMYGRLAEGIELRPDRDPEGKNYTPFEVYGGSKWPVFLAGNVAYLFSTRLAQPLFEKTIEKRYGRCDDALITGVIAEELGFKRIMAKFACRNMKLKGISKDELEKIKLWNQVIPQPGGSKTNCEVK